MSSSTNNNNKECEHKFYPYRIGLALFVECQDMINYKIIAS